MAKSISHNDSTLPINTIHKLIDLPLALLLQPFNIRPVLLDDGCLLLDLHLERCPLVLQNPLNFGDFLDVTLVRLPHPVQDLLLGQIFLGGHLHLGDVEFAKLADVGQEFLVDFG